MGLWIIQTRQDIVLLERRVANEFLKLIPVGSLSGNK